MSRKKRVGSCNRNKDARVIERMKDIEVLQAQVHPKGWGEEVWIINTEQYCGKLLKFNAGASFSDHFHILKDEAWYVLEGELELSHYDLSTAERKTITLKKGDVVHVPPHQPHQLRALVASTVIEVSTTHREDDSYRIGKGDGQK